MRHVFLYCASSVIGGLLATTLYTLIAVADDHAVLPRFLLASSVLGISAGLVMLQYVRTRVRNLYQHRVFTVIKLGVIELQAFFGIGVGILIGLLAAWLLVFPFSVLFGHPFVDDAAHLGRARVYFFLTLFIITISASVTGRYFFMRAVKSTVRKSEIA